MSGRLWYPQLDPYDAIRRIGALLMSFAPAPGVERLYIADFYLANPPLLHRTTMLLDTRRAFNSLKIPRPEKSFLDYPAAPLLFHLMEPIQREAVRAMAGKGLISIESLKRKVAEPTDSGRIAFGAELSHRLTETEPHLVRFLTQDFAGDAAVGAAELRKSTGLRRVG